MKKSVRKSQAFLLSTTALFATMVFPTASMAETCMTDDLLMVYEPVETAPRKHVRSVKHQSKTTIASNHKNQKPKVALDLLKAGT